MSATLTYRDTAVAAASKLVELRNALLCGMAVVIAVALTNPICNAPFNDDWSYSFTVKHLLETGKLTYNGWASASLIAQAYWGLLWVKLFGFSYTVLRLSTIPLAAGAISICYLLARRVGLNTRFAIFATLLLGLSPLYLPVAGSFMTDAPGLFFTLLSMYALARAMEDIPVPSAVSWLILGTVVGLIGGTGRQIVWVVPLVMLPYIAWIRRKNMPLVICAIISWIIVFEGTRLTLHWFSRQPYSIPETPFHIELRYALGKPAHFILNVLAFPLTTIWMILPALWGVFTRGWTWQRVIVALLILIGPFQFIVHSRPRYGVAPWMGNTLSAQGVMGGAELAGDRPTVLPRAVRVVLARVVFCIASILLADLLLRLLRPFTEVRATTKFFLYPDKNKALLPAMLLFASAYFVLLLPRCATNMAYDRYILPLMPCVLFPLFLSYQSYGETKPPRVGWILLGMYALLAIGITQEVTALGRARAEGVNRLLASGVTRTLIDAGFEVDYEAQILTTGYINDPRIRIPRGAYKADRGPTYTVQSLYRLEFAPAPDTTTTEFGTVDFTTYLFPFHRRIYIDKFVDAWWLNRAKAATRPADKWHAYIPTDLGGDDEK